MTCANLKGEMKDARLMKIGDAAGELGSETPKLFVVLDATICRDAPAELVHDELPDSEQEVVMRRAIVMHCHDMLRDRARFRAECHLIHALVCLARELDNAHFS